MITEILQKEQATLGNLLDGIAEVYIDPLAAVAALESGSNVCLLSDPAIAPNGLRTGSVEFTFTVLLAVPGDVVTGRDFFGNALIALLPLGYPDAHPQSTTFGERKNYFSYSLTYKADYEI